MDIKKKEEETKLWIEDKIKNFKDKELEKSLTKEQKNFIIKIYRRFVTEFYVYNNIDKEFEQIKSHKEITKMVFDEFLNSEDENYKKELYKTMLPLIGEFSYINNKEYDYYHIEKIWLDFFKDYIPNGTKKIMEVIEKDWLDYLIKEDPFSKYKSKEEIEEDIFRLKENVRRIACGLKNNIYKDEYSPTFLEYSEENEAKKAIYNSFLNSENEDIVKYIVSNGNNEEIRYRESKWERKRENSYRHEGMLSKLEKYPEPIIDNLYKNKDWGSITKILKNATPNIKEILIKRLNELNDIIKSVNFNEYKRYADENMPRFIIPSEYNEKDGKKYAGSKIYGVKVSIDTFIPFKDIEKYGYEKRLEKHKGKFTPYENVSKKRKIINGDGSKTLRDISKIEGYGSIPEKIFQVQQKVDILKENPGEILNFLKKEGMGKIIEFLPKKYQKKYIDTAFKSDNYVIFNIDDKIKGDNKVMNQIYLLSTNNKFIIEKIFNDPIMAKSILKDSIRAKLGDKNSEDFINKFLSKNTKAFKYVSEFFQDPKNKETIQELKKEVEEDIKEEKRLEGEKTIEDSIDRLTGISNEEVSQMGIESDSSSFHKLMNDFKSLGD